ncbi:hypothetical protein E8E13_002393 [Curvularia kusanoi]|uniref:Prion-inhibition and propagation HeLo domain-containing protein n=1 Tax=Curvularia kusanoi TaxID=90978 RepID=A0A9P4T472_CURKU|nr:hypothetical protein E8E13_002393 [Curvularia kusanoi]
MPFRLILSDEANDRWTVSAMVRTGVSAAGAEREMTEVAGLVIGAVSLAATFTTCVDCFEYIQLGRNFGKDYQRSLLKLDIAKLRLSRWADAVSESHNQYQVPLRTPADAQTVESLLGNIIDCFADAERVSRRFEAKSNNPTELQVYNANTDLEPSLQTMHDKMRDLALRRQQRSTIRQKAAWALYEKRYFDRLIVDVVSLIEDLTQLFPAIQQRQSELVAEEIREIVSQPAFAEVESAAEDIDTLLVSSIQQALAAQGSHNFNKNTVTDEADAQYGDQSLADEEAGSDITGSPFSVRKLVAAQGLDAAFGRPDHRKRKRAGEVEWSSNKRRRV